MKTSYFAAWKKHRWPSAISVAKGTPWWFEGLDYQMLAPPQSLLSDWHAGQLTEEQYTQRYHQEVLAGLDPVRVAGDLAALAGGAEPVLLCWERVGEFCHRSACVAPWLRAAGIACEEAE